MKTSNLPGPKIIKDDCGCFQTLRGVYKCNEHREGECRAILSQVELLKTAKNAIEILINGDGTDSLMEDYVIDAIGKLRAAIIKAGG